MRYKNEIWEYYIRYKDEKRLIDHKKEKGRENVLAFYDMEDEMFFRLLNTFSWLVKHNSPSMKIDSPLSKPTNADILEALDMMKNEGLDLSLHYKDYPKGALRDGLRKKANNLLKCVEYYKELVQRNYFS